MNLYLPRGWTEENASSLEKRRQLAKRSYGTTFKSVGGSADPLRLGTYSQKGHPTNMACAVELIVYRYHSKLVAHENSNK